MDQKRIAFATAFTLSGLVTALFISWYILAQMNFLYGFWHDHVGIGAGIEEFGPQNRYREGFADTTRAERLRIFREVNNAIHRSGEGLAGIVYRTNKSAAAQPLLREPEVGHLQDVARLIDHLKVPVAVALAIWLACVGWALTQKQRLPSLPRQMAGMVAGVAVSGVLILLIGPERVFNQLHIWVFPPDHPWFFYYQDSLMSTMMMAPRLFGWVTVVWVPFAITCFFLLQGGVSLMSQKFSLNNCDSESAGGTGRDKTHVTRKLKRTKTYRKKKRA